MYKNLTITSFIGFLAIILGAFGAHALKNKLNIDELNSFNTAVRYQVYHVIVLLFVNIYTEFSKKQKNIISKIFFLGILFFSGSIYLIHLTPITAKTIWFITPLGGLFFIFGWLLMMIYFIKKGKKTIN